MVIKTKTITIESGPDAGKVFELTMPDAFRGEDLFIKIMSVCSTADGSDEISKRLMATEDGRKVWYSLLDFVKIIPNTMARSIDKNDIESPQTLIRLRTEVLNLLMGFITE